MIEFVGNSNNVINWSAVIQSLEQQTPAYFGINFKLSTQKDNTLLVKDWESCGFVFQEDGGTIGWDIFIPEKNFDVQIVQTFTDYFKIKNYNNAWITRINVGMHIPEYNEFDQSDAITPRWHCHMADDESSVLYIGEQILYNQRQGDTYQWGDNKINYAFGNISFKPKYFFNIS